MAESSSEAEQSLLVSTGKILFSIGGIYFAFVMFTMKLEETYKADYGGMKNHMCWVPVMIQSFLAFFLAYIILKKTNRLNFDVLKDMDVIKSSVFIFVGLIASNYSLRHISFLLQMMIKSGKCISAMLLTFLFPPNKGQRLVSKTNLFFAAVITGGIVMFQLSV